MGSRYFTTALSVLGIGVMLTGVICLDRFDGNACLLPADAALPDDADEGEYGFSTETADPPAVRARQKSVEVALYAQTELLEQAHRQLMSDTPNRIDMYFLGIAGDSGQDVFLKEIQLVRNLFDTTFATDQRSLVLINNRQTLTSAPIATQTSLNKSLDAVAEKMDTEEDILFLYMTSHGSADHQFSIDVQGMDLPSIAAEDLAHSLRSSAIKWKVIVISACYSGGFIPLLKNNETLVITAARADRMSFGCGKDSDMTYFGRAFFEQALPDASSFEDAFHTARELIEHREDEENPDDPHSEPQIALGKNIRVHLEEWWHETSRAQKVAQETIRR